MPVRDLGERPTSLTTPVDVSEWVVKTTLDAAAGSPSACSRSSGSILLAPLDLVVVQFGAVGLAQLSPALSELAAGSDQDVSPGATRFATADSIAPVPEAANASTSHSVWKTVFRPLQARARRSR